MRINKSQTKQKLWDYVNNPESELPDDWTNGKKALFKRWLMHKLDQKTIPEQERWLCTMCEKLGLTPDYDDTTTISKKKQESLQRIRQSLL